MKDVTPMRDLMVVEVFEKSEVTEGGIVLPGQAVEHNTRQARVLVIGEGATNEKTGDLMEVDVNVGDVVLFHGGIRVSGDREKPERFLIREEDILAIVD